LLVHRRRRAVAAEAASQDNFTMKAKLAIMILGALVLMANGANAQHRNYSHGYARDETPQYQSSGGLYGSLAQGQQSYPNPDRETYVNRSCCNWKSNHKAKHAIKHS
jgi:hypothetical protein